MSHIPEYETIVEKLIGLGYQKMEVAKMAYGHEVEVWTFGSKTILLYTMPHIRANAVSKKRLSVFAPITYGSALPSEIKLLEDYTGGGK